MRPVRSIVLLVWLCSAGTMPAFAQIQGPPPRSSTPPSTPFLGGIPSGEPTREVLPLSIADAISRALMNNLGLLLAEDGVDRARGARLRALSELLPNVRARLTESRQIVNLEAFGFPRPAGFPAIAGPFNVFDARVFLTQSILDFKALHEARAELHNVAAARHDYKSARDLVVLVTTVSYAQALASSARVDAARAQVDTARALFSQATDLKQNGLVAGIDVLRAEMQLSTERQRFTAARNEFEKAKLQLARLVGLPLGQTFTLVTQLSGLDIPAMTLEEALERAYQTRPDYLAAIERVKAAESARRAAAGELRPAVRVAANYGDIGLTPADAHATYSVAGAVDIPIFQGGRSRGRMLEANADLRRRRSDADDLKGAIYYEVRTALLDIQAGTEQLEVATRARELSASELTQARDRFAAGIAGNIEVVQAQAAVALADDQYISALFTTSLAKGSLVRAVGIAEEIARQLFGGAR